MKTIGIIPARYDSTRFPGKPLALIGNKTMIQRVWERSSLSNLNEVIIATDNEKIRKHAESFGAKVLMTSKDHKTGTDRIAEAYRINGKDYDVVVNIQGDEPFIDPKQIDKLTSAFKGRKVKISTLAEKFEESDLLHSPNVVKVVLDKNNHALYFSRASIPFIRAEQNGRWAQNTSFFRHIGVYAFRASVLQEVVKLPQHSLELAESLEQLRWLANGYRIFVIETKYSGISIDTPEDLQKANEILQTVYH